MVNAKPTILIIIGISGDLAQRKLLPAIGKIAKAGELPEDFRLVGITRRSDLTLDSLLHAEESSFAYLKRHGEIFQMNLADEADYKKLGNHLEQIDSSFSKKAQRLFYLAVPPQISKPIVEFIGTSGLSKNTQTKILLEKPFGVDLESAQELVADIVKYFKPEQVYRIDHYLAKETAQNLIIFRQDNSLFRRTWNKDFIESIHITASESIGIEGRVAFYEQTGALRDIVQSHLLQLAALTLMDTPTDEQLDDVPARRLEALAHLSVPLEQGVTTSAIRGQYRGYSQEVDNPGSLVETFVSLKLESKAPRWQGVPITLTTGKSLRYKRTEIKITYKRERGQEANELTILLQPDEGIELGIWAKQPGYSLQVSQHSLRFAFKEHYSEFPEAYEQVLFSAINSDNTLFTSSGEVLETWRILNPIQKTWAMNNDDLIIYEPGSSVDGVLASRKQ